MTRPASEGHRATAGHAPPSPRLLILGASVRAAAASAVRSGFVPIGVDLFADRDLAALGPARRVDRDDYPGGLARLADEWPGVPWIYTGTLENHPALIDGLASRRPLLGIGGPALRDVRDPRRWSGILHGASLPALEICVEGDEPPRDGQWLIKPLASGAGRGIRPWTVGEGPVPCGYQVQRLIRGTSLGATFLGSEGSARLIGVTRQLLGRAASGLRVAYRGSVGPWPVSPRVEARMARIGEALASAFGLSGLFGIDFVVRGDVPWAVEVNPRYTASVEVIEASLGLPLMGMHARACGLVPPTPTRDLPRAGAVAKRVLMARRAGVVPEDWPWSDPASGRPVVADIPTSGTRLDPGDPVLTVLARGKDVAEALARLKVRSARWRRRIDGWSAP